MSRYYARPTGQSVMGPAPKVAPAADKPQHTIVQKRDVIHNHHTEPHRVSHVDGTSKRYPDGQKDDVDVVAGEICFQYATPGSHKVSSSFNGMPKSCNWAVQGVAVGSTVNNDGGRHPQVGVAYSGFLRIPNGPHSFQPGDYVLCVSPNEKDAMRLFGGDQTGLASASRTKLRVVPQPLRLVMGDFTKPIDNFANAMQKQVQDILNATDDTGGESKAAAGDLETRLKGEKELQDRDLVKYLQSAEGSTPLSRVVLKAKIDRDLWQIMTIASSGHYRVFDSNCTIVQDAQRVAIKYFLLASSVVAKISQTPTLSNLDILQAQTKFASFLNVLVSNILQTKVLGLCLGYAGPFQKIPVIIGRRPGMLL